MHNAIFSHRNSCPLFTASSLRCPSLFFSIARDNVLHRAHRLSAFASIFPFAARVYCTKQQEICQESQRSDVATGNAALSIANAKTQRCGALSSGISRQNPGISRPKSLISLVLRDVSNFLAPTPSRGRPLPHRKISGLKSLDLGSFFVPEKCPNLGRDSISCWRIIGE